MSDFAQEIIHIQILADKGLIFVDTVIAITEKF